MTDLFFFSKVKVFEKSGAMNFLIAGQETKDTLISLDDSTIKNPIDTKESQDNKSEMFTNCALMTTSDNLVSIEDSTITKNTNNALAIKKGDCTEVNTNDDLILLDDCTMPNLKDSLIIPKNHTDPLVNFVQETEL